MLDAREFYVELKDQIEHQILPKACYVDLLEFYDERNRMADALCKILTESTCQGLLRWRRLFFNDDKIILSWLCKLLFDKYEIEDNVENIHVKMIEDDALGNYLYVSIYEKEKRSKDWLISYPSGLY